LDKANSLPDIRSLSKEDIAAQLESWREPKYRLEQILKWIYEMRVGSFEQMKNLPAALRTRLKETYGFYTFELVKCSGARDETIKFLWRLADGALIESVVIPANPAIYGDSSDRKTLCLSTQVGCAYKCGFCASGMLGWRRDLSSAEIVEQWLAIERWYRAQEPREGTAPVARLVNNIVVMGMGEPLANYENLLGALRVLNAPWGGAIGARKITISTCGLVPQIRMLAKEPYQFRLAISLHGVTDDIRGQIMPVNRKYPVQQLMAACEDYLKVKERMISFEYILIKGLNTDKEQAMLLAQLARRMKAHVNLIAYNTVEGLTYERPTEAEQDAFYKQLADQGVTVSLRREKGSDIDAACGQLRLRVEKEMTSESQTGLSNNPVDPAAI
jgi:23S rRNA (adenine2503-C2)-methyltransferase